MIPTMLLAGLLIGRHWAIVAGGVGWAVVLLMTGTIGVLDVPVAVLLGGANVAVGLFVRRALAWLLGVRLRSPGTA